MLCPSAVKGFCPSTDPVEEYDGEWWQELYCQTCGYEEKVKFTTARKKFTSNYQPHKSVAATAAEAKKKKQQH